MSKIHILHVVPTLKAGGMEMALSRVVKGLMPEGITHSIVVLKGEAIIRDLFDPAVNIHCLDAKPNDPGVILQLRRLIQKERPTVIHARNLGAWPEIAVARLTVWPLVPLVFSFHGVSVPGPPPLRWRLICRLLSFFTSEIFTVSHGSKQFLAEQVGLSVSRVAVIPNGVDSTRFYPVAKPSGRDGCLIGTLGSLTPVKNQAILIKACHRLIQAGINIKLEIAGEGPERENLERLIDSLGVSENIKLIGHITDTATFLNKLDIFVLSSDSEAHPNALSEAMACGLPCISSRVGGVTEILDQGQAGILFEPRDENGLVEAIKTLSVNPSIQQTLSSAARKQICDRYSMAVMLDRYRRLYLRLSGVDTT